MFLVETNNLLDCLIYIPFLYTLEFRAMIFFMERNVQQTGFINLVIYIDNLQ